MVRALRYALQDRTGIECSARSLLFNMLVMHANWLYCRYQPRQNGLTPFEDQHGRGYHGQLYQFGQAVMARLPSALDQPKYKSGLLYTSDAAD